MVKQQIFNGKTVEEAIETGLAALSVSRDQAEIEILEEGKKETVRFRARAGENYR